MVDLVPKKASKNWKKLLLASASMSVLLVNRSLHLLSDLSGSQSPLKLSLSALVVTSFVVTVVIVELADSSANLDVGYRLLGNAE